MHVVKAEMTKSFEEYQSLSQNERGAAALIVELVETITTAILLRQTSPPASRCYVSRDYYFSHIAIHGACCL